MQTLKYGSFTYYVDHAVKGADFIHGYDSTGRLVVSLEGINDFSDFEYTGEFMAPEECLEEACNNVKYINGEFVRPDGTRVSGDFSDEHGNLNVPNNLKVGNKIILTPESYGDTLPATGEVGQLFFLKV